MNENYDPREAAKQAAQDRVAQQANKPEPVAGQGSVAKGPVVQTGQLQVVQAAPAVQAAQAAPAAVPMTAAEQMNSQLLQILINQQARLAAKDQQEEDARKTRDAQRAKNAQDHTAKDLIRQARCTHLKGGRKGPRSQVRDYAVYLFTYINNTHTIRCFICKMTWKINDTAEFLIRHGKKIANHTKIGWYEASKMLEQTTNTPGSSEIPTQPMTALAQSLED